MSQNLVVEACGHVVLAGGAVSATTWAKGATVTDGGAGTTTITLDRACDALQSLVSLTGVNSGPTYASLSAVATSDTVYTVTGSNAGGAATDNLSFDFKIERRPGT